MKPLHQKIRDDIEGQIRSGALKPGDRIPFEHELMAHYGVSRMTVNKALTPLDEAGLIERRKRAGSFVRLPRLDSTVLDIPDIQHEITARGEAYHFELLSYTIRTASTDEERELAGSGQVISLTGLHFASAKPLAFERRLINLEAVPDAETIDFTRQSPGHWLLGAVPWTHVENQISAAVAEGQIARHLRLDAGAPCLVVDRRTWRDKARVTTVRQVFDGAAYRLIARFDHG
ncbi:histidine utilization repressor [Asticcacaulis sp. 201]|uniref:histidine utilization repressor n=1 Tax=Asticcacaulis sp. 201 TaxID=3028787 RepID=UPI002915E615|nr:histidine utilization repressor [Asticcacaulis sp. 201]MDV6330313.1 histidine utilization repressor [Asticcacaulis sp. 201]